MKFKKADCPLCGTNDHYPFGSMELQDGERRASGLKSVSYSLCKCGFVFHSKMMTKGTSQRYYRSTYRATHGNKRITDKDYSTETKRAKRVLRHLGNRTIKKSLDVGCSTGTLLTYLREAYGCEVVGVEPNKIFSANAKLLGINVVGDIKYVQGKYDLITIIHVLEHVQKPLEMLEQAFRLLEIGGIIVVEVPILNMLDYSFGLAHCIAFTRKTLFKILLKAGFELVEEFEGEHLMVIAKGA